MTDRPLTLFISHPSQLLTDSQPHGDGLIANALLRRLAARGHHLHVAVSLSALDEPVSENLHLHPVPTRVQHTEERQGLAYRMEYAWRVRRLFGQLRRSLHFDVVHQMNPIVSGMSTFFLHCGTPLLMGPFWPLWPRPSSAGKKHHLLETLRLAALVLRFLPADGILSPTPASTAIVPAAIRSRTRLFPFPLGIDTEHFKPAARQPAPPQTILYLANIQRRKGVFILLEAFERLSAQFPAAQLIFAGVGYQFEELQQRVAASPCRAHIQVRGNVPRAEVPATLQAATIYCLPSFGEPYGMSALEAMSCGKPLVVTTNGGLGHLVPDGGALKVEAGNVGQLTHALATLLLDPALQARLGHFNRHHVEQHHAWDRVMDNLESAYLSLMAPHATAP